MAKYLDYSGLQYLWTKIKNYVSTQPLGANVRYDVQSLTDAQKEQARKNIGAGNTNPNLLDNWYFVGGGTNGNLPINQRGQTSYSAYTFGIDRWYAAAAMTVAADGISCGAIVQKLPQVAPIDGKTLTFSALLADGTMLSGSAVFNSASDTYFYYDAGASEYLLYNTYFGGFEAVTARKIAAVKLEVGSVSTLQYDAPPSYGEELTKCIYSKADQNDLYANNGFGRSNPNLLDNAYFVGGGSQLGDGVFPINQRGLTSYTNTTYIVDRWRMWANTSTVTLTASGLTFATGANSDGLFQYSPQGKIESLYGLTVTASLLLTDGTLYTATGVADAACWIATDINGGYFGYTNGYFRVNLDANKSISIKAVKLEEGTVSTLANDVAPDFGEELRKCQRYLRYVFCDANYLVAMTTLEGIEMRATPTPSLVSAGYIFNPATSATSVPTAVSILAFEYNTATIQLSIPASFNGFCIAVDSAICLSAEL